jgi:hypothetical protein
MHPMFIMFLIIAGVVVTTALFVFWMVINVLRGVSRLVFGPPPQRQPRGMTRQPPPPALAPMRMCERDSCRALNPIEAGFCRRCGHRFGAPQHAPVRRAAML